MMYYVMILCHVLYDIVKYDIIWYNIQLYAIIFMVKYLLPNTDSIS